MECAPGALGKLVALLSCLCVGVRSLEHRVDDGGEPAAGGTGLGGAWVIKWRWGNNRLERSVAGGGGCAVEAGWPVRW
jgi:hypothetical protein